MMMRIHERPQNPEDHQGLEKLQISKVSFNLKGLSQQIPNNYNR